MHDVRRPALLALAFLVCAACGASSSTGEMLGPRPGPDWTEVGVQVWNGTRTEIVARILAHERSGRVRVLAERLVVPAGSRDIHPSLGDDPNRARIVNTWLKPGAWEVEVVVGDRMARCAMSEASARWCIADVGAGQIAMTSAEGPRRLE